MPDYCHFYSQKTRLVPSPLSLLPHKTSALAADENNHGGFSTKLVGYFYEWAAKRPRPFAGPQVARFGWSTSHIFTHRHSKHGSLGSRPSPCHPLCHCPTNKLLLLPCLTLHMFIFYLFFQTMPPISDHNTTTATTDDATNPTPLSNTYSPSLAFNCHCHLLWRRTPPPKSINLRSMMPAYLSIIKKSAFHHFYNERHHNI